MQTAKDAINPRNVQMAETLGDPRGGIPDGNIPAAALAESETAHERLPGQDLDYDIERGRPSPMAQRAGMGWAPVILAALAGVLVYGLFRSKKAY
jgi:hypothetical protein